MVDLSLVPTTDLRRMAAAGEEICGIRQSLAAAGENVVTEILRDQGEFYEWDHYPKGDVYDRETHSQYYYHAHPPERRFPSEHGHFHTFLRARGMPAGMRPDPDALCGAAPEDPLSHLIAIAMNTAGEPFRLFTANRWVTNDVWYKGEDVCNMLDGFSVGQRPDPVNRWITSMLVLFGPQIRDLVRARDQRVAAWQKKFPDREVFEDRDLEVTSQAEISVGQQCREIARALAARQG